jgi:hypothetical protein
MIVLKLRLIILGLILVACWGGPWLWAAEISVPLPADAVKISEKNTSIGPFKSTVEIYQSYLAQNKIDAFYKKEMLRAGWIQNKSGLFTKNGYSAVITSSPIKNKEGAVQFLVATSKIPDKEMLLAERKAKPDKVNFMPVYPGCIQNFLWDLPTGVSGSYETESSVQDVIFFYKSGMLNYGWYLYSEVPLKSEVINYPGQDKANPPVTSSSASLRFRKKSGESCVIMINNISSMEFLLPGEQLVDTKNINLSSKTTILVVYNDQKRIDQ